MSEPRKNHLTIDGGKVKEDEHVSSYKAIPETDTEFRSSKPNLAKSKEKLSPDGAEEKLLAKEDEAKIVTRVDMADAKYVVGDHRNGDAKIELDANKRQFSGLTKEELLKYADDPFWVNLRWSMFVLFWAAWLAMLAGAIAIIVRAPTCAPPVPKTWYEKGPLVETEGLTSEALYEELPTLDSANAEAIFMEVPSSSSYDLLDKPDILKQLQEAITKVKNYGMKVIIDLTPNFVPKEHIWFQKSENRTNPYTDYFIWRNGKGYMEDTELLPTNWRSTLNEAAWTKSEKRQQFYLHQYSENTPDLNFRNSEVVGHFEKVLEACMNIGAHGVRLNKVRQLFINASFADEIRAEGKGTDLAADHLQYSYWRHLKTSDQPELDQLLAKWSALVDSKSTTPNTNDTVFTMKEEPGRPELVVLRPNKFSLRPASAAPLLLGDDVNAFAGALNAKLEKMTWPAIQLISSEEVRPALAPFAALLPAAPILDWSQIKESNETTSSEKLSELLALRDDASIAHGNYSIAAIPARNSTENALVACARWKAGHTGFLVLLNPSAEEKRANLTSLPSLPQTLSVHHMVPTVRMYTNFTTNHILPTDDVLVPPQSSIVLSYVPVTAVEE